MRNILKWNEIAEKNKIKQIHKKKQEKSANDNC